MFVDRYYINFAFGIWHIILSLLVPLLILIIDLQQIALQDAPQAQATSTFIAVVFVTTAALILEFTKQYCQTTYSTRIRGRAAKALLILSAGCLFFTYHLLQPEAIDLIYTHTSIYAGILFALWAYPITVSSEELILCYRLEFGPNPKRFSESLIDYSEAYIL